MNKKVALYNKMSIPLKPSFAVHKSTPAVFQKFSN